MTSNERRNELYCRLDEIEQTLEELECERDRVFAALSKLDERDRREAAEACAEGRHA